MKKTICLLLCLLFLGAALAGCSPKPTSAGAQLAGDRSSSSGEQPVHLTFYAYGFQALVNLPGYEEQTKELGSAYQLIIDEFTREHPNVTIELVTINPAGGGTEQLDVDLASGETPNLYYDSLLRISKYNGLGYLLDLRGYADPAFVDGFTQGAVEEGSLFYLPTGMTPMCLCINKTLFESIGAAELLPSPDDRNWTTEEYLAALQAVRDAALPGVYPTILWAANQSGDACNMAYLWGFGARFFADGDGSRVVLDTPEGRAALRFLNNLAGSGLAVPGAAGLNDDDMWALWQSGRLAVTGGYPYLETLAAGADTPFEPYFVNYPHEKDRPVPPVTPDTHAVAVFASENEAENEMAVQFAEYLAGSGWAVALSRALGDMTVHASLEGELALSEQYAGLKKVMDECGILSYGPAYAGWSALRPLYASELQAMFSGTKTPEQTAADFAAAADAALAG